MGAPFWVDRAACRGMDTARFFPEGEQEPDPEIRAVCATCAVQAECHDAGFGNCGVWGGRTEAERRNYRRVQQRRAQRHATRHQAA